MAVFSTPFSTSSVKGSVLFSVVFYNFILEFSQV